MFWRKLSRGDVKASAREDDVPSIPERKLSGKGRNTFPRQATRRRETMDVFRFDQPVLSQPPKVKKVWSLATEENPAGVKHAVKQPSDVAWLDDNYFVVCDSEGHRLLVFDITGHLVTVLCNGSLWPNCIAITRDAKIVATDRKKKLVNIYDLTGQCINSFGEPILYVGEEEIDLRPHGVAVNSRGQIIVTETHQSIIKVYSPEGKFLRQMGTKGRGVNELDLPFYITVNHQDDVIVSDNMNYALKVFDASGNFRFKIGSGQDWRQFQCPFGVCTDSRNNILVVDGESHRVHSYSPHGESLGDILGKQDQCRHPAGIAVNTHGDMVITESSLDYSNVKLYRTFYEE